MKTLIHIIFVKVISGISKKTNNPYDMRMAQCIAQVSNKEGVLEPLVGELILPADYKDLQPGFYLVDFRLSVTAEKRIESVVNSLTPCNDKGVPVAPPPQKQAA